MNKGDIKSSNKFLVLKLIGFSSLLWPLGAIAFPMSRSVTVFSSLCVFMGWLFLVYAIFFWRFPKSSSAYYSLIIAMFTMLLSMILYEESEFFRSAKTFVSPAMFLVLIFIISYSPNQKISNYSFSRLGVMIFNVALLVSLFGVLEMTVRTFWPPLGNIWYGKMGASGFPGVEYLKYGYMNYGFIFNGQRPLGLFGDQHTAPLVGVVCAIYFSATGARWRYWLAIVAVILTFRWTYYLIIPFLVFIDSPLSNNRIFVIFVGILSGFPFVSLFYYISNDNAGSVIISHLIASTDLFSMPWYELLLGIGYSGKLETEFGFNEIFILKYIHFFGVFGAIYFMYLVLMPIFIYLKIKRRINSFKKISIESLIVKPKSFLLLSLVPIIGTIHYNAFFTPSISFLYGFLLVLGLLSIKETFEDIIVPEKLQVELQR